MVKQIEINTEETSIPETKTQNNDEEQIASFRAKNGM